MILPINSWVLFEALPNILLPEITTVWVSIRVVPPTLNKSAITLLAIISLLALILAASISPLALILPSKTASVLSMVAAIWLPAVLN